MGNELEKFEFLPIEQAKTARKGLIHCFENSYWCVHPQRGLAFYNPRHRKDDHETVLGSPQCNSSEAIAKMITRNRDWAEVVFIDKAFVDVDPRCFKD